MNAQLKTWAKAGAVPCEAQKSGGLLQRKCDFGNHTPAGKDHEERRDGHEASLRRAVVRSEPVRSPPPIVDEVLRSSGQPLDSPARAFFEPRFDHDFSRVRVHTDARAAASARSVGALAYTVGRHLVFGLDQYRPGTRGGQRLLAHELAHVVQQTPREGVVPASGRLRIEEGRVPNERAAEQKVEQILGSPSTTVRNPRKEVPTPLEEIGVPVLQRAVSPRMPTIRERLSTGIFNSVTEAEAHEVLIILKRLRQTSEVDFRDTVAAMEAEGLAGRLLAGVSQADRLEEPEILRQIANARVFTRERSHGGTTVTTTVTGSCSPERYQRIHAAATQAIAWLDRAVTLTDAYLRAPGAAPSASTRRALNLHFHSTASRIGQHVRARLNHISRDIQSADPFSLECHGTWDTECSGNVAYIPGGEPERTVFCPGFFRSSQRGRVRTLIHEMAHTQVGGIHITDRAYTGERALRYLSTAEALTNAESYERYVVHLATGQAPASLLPRDTREDCPGDWWSALQRTLAEAQRANRNAENLMSDVTPASLRRWTASRRQLLGGDTQSDIDRARGVFRRADSRLDSAVDFECEPEGGGRCDRYETYWYALGDFHVCPSWRTLASNEARTISLLSGLYGYFGAEADNRRRRGYARLAYEVTRQWWGAPTLGEVLGGTAWRSDQLTINATFHLQLPTPLPNPWMVESGNRHRRLSTYLPVYRGPEFQHRPLPFGCDVSFSVDALGRERRLPFTPPTVSVLFEHQATWGSGFRRSERDPRPDYRNAGSPLRTSFDRRFDFTLNRNGTLHMRFELRDPDSGVNRVYDDFIAVDVERIRDIIPSGSTRLA